MLKNKISLAFYILLALANLSFASSNNIENKNIKIIDISNGDGMKSFIKKVREYNIDKNSLGTPFIAIGKNYILG